MEDGNKIDLRGVLGWFAFPPNADSVQSAGKGIVSFFLMLKIVEVLKRGDEFAGGGFMSQIFNGVTDSEHGFVIKDVVDVGGGYRLGFG